MQTTENPTNSALEVSNMDDSGGDMTGVVPIGDAEKVEKWLLAFVNKVTEGAKSINADRLAKIRALDTARAKARLKFGNSDRMMRLKEKVEIPEADNQCDTLAALMLDSIRANGGIIDIKADNCALEEQAECLKRLIEGELNYQNFDQELEEAAYRFTRYESGLKVMPVMQPEVEYERRMEDPEVFDQVGPADGEKPVGDPEVELAAGATGIPVMSKLGPRNRIGVVVKSVNPRNILISDNFRPIQNQLAIHEFHYVTLEELEEVPGVIVDAKKLGQPNSDGRQNPDTSGTIQQNSASDQTAFPLYEIVETWVEPQWRRGIRDGKFDESDLNAFSQKWNIVPDEFYEKQKWQIFHKGLDCLLKVNPTYLLRKRGFPYHMASCFPPDNETFGLAMRDRINDLEQWLSALINSFLDNIRTNMKQAMFLNKSSLLKQEDLNVMDDADRPIIWLSGQFNPRDEIYFHQVPDMTGQIVQITDLIQMFLQRYGVPPELMGFGATKTATGSNINNQRGQQKVNSVYSRFVWLILVPAIEDMADILFQNITPLELYYRLGIDAHALAGREFTDPLQNAYKFKILPSGAPELGSRQSKAQALTGLMNVLMPILTNPGAPPQAIKAMSLVLSYAGLSPSEIESVTGYTNIGSIIQDQIAALEADPNLDLVQRVKEGDNHELALKLLQAKSSENPQFGMQGNVERYANAHMAFLQAQMLMQQQQGAPGASKGPPVQPGDPTASGDVSNARRGAQLNSTSDQGAKTQAGLTGTGSV